jgi:hypothetical protein
MRQFDLIRNKITADCEFCDRAHPKGIYYHMTKQISPPTAVCRRYGDARVVHNAARPPHARLLSIKSFVAGSTPSAMMKVDNDDVLFGASAHMQEPRR